MNELFLSYQGLLRTLPPVFAADGIDVYLGGKNSDWWNHLPQLTPQELAQDRARLQQLFSVGEVESWWAGFLNTCYDHADLNTSGKMGERNIVAMHPYYDELESENAHGVKTAEPISRLENLLRNADRQRFGRVLVDSPTHYGMKSHELVDEGCIDKVIFSETYRGIPLDLNDARKFADTRMNFYGGAYGYRCVNFMQLVIAINPLIVRPIKDAILYKEFIRNLNSWREILYVHLVGIKSSVLLNAG